MEKSYENNGHWKKEGWNAWVARTMKILPDSVLPVFHVLKII
jgi:hypothetical protein